MPIIRTDTIVCPDCGWLQDAPIEFRNRDPYPTYFKECERCGYLILESEWQSVRDALRIHEEISRRPGRWSLINALRLLRRIPIPTTWSPFHRKGARYAR